jgi:hypothetical protein
VSVDINEENILLLINKDFVIFVSDYSITGLRSAGEIFMQVFPNLLNRTKQTFYLLFCVSA